MNAEPPMPDPGTQRYPNVLRPLAIGPVAVRNRILVPAHTTDYGENNLPSARHLAYHRERARGGAGLIIFDATRVHRTGLGRRQAVNGYQPAAIDAFAPIARAVQAEGAKLFAQIIHLGRHIDGNYARMPAWSASAVPWSASAAPPHPITEAEIAEVVAAHALVARNLMQAGVGRRGGDHRARPPVATVPVLGFEFSHHRYGGSAENHMRFALEALHAVRAAVGDRLAVGIRISADEFLDGGLTLEDMRRITVAICAAVRLDFVNVSHSAYHGSATISTQMADMASPPTVFTICRAASRHRGGAARGRVSNSGVRGVPLPPRRRGR